MLVDVRVVLVEVPVAVLTGASSRFGVTFACRGSSAPVLAAGLPRPGAPIPPLHGDRQVVGAAQDLVAQDGLQQTGGDRDPTGQHQGVAEAGGISST